ncbi:MAG TPA: hypothetical protein PLG56_04010, partial [Lacunisphaera sp.]|nr:hypothetical protein [Lacunisphaera sp.]
PQATASVAADLSALPARLSLGGLTGGAFSGAVHEVLIYNRALSAEERETVEDDLLLRNQLNDLDRSGLPDRWERRHFGHTGVDPNADADGDGLSNRDEYVFSATPTVADSDGDGYNDGQELALGTDPADPNSKGVNQVTWLARYTTVTAAGPPEIAFWPGVTSFLGALPTFGKLEWSLTQSGAKQGNGLYRIEMELGADLTSWTIDNQIGGFNGYYGAGTFWTYLPPGLSHHTSLPFSWEGIAGFGGVRTDSVAAVNRHGGSLTATALSWTESWAYLDDNGQVRHYTNAVEMRLSRPQDPVYTVPPGQTSTGGWAPGAPAISRSAASEDSAEYHLLVPAGTTGTLRWFEVFTPADGGAKTYALQEWPIESGATKSPSHTLSCPADGTATVELLEFTGQLAVDANRDSVIQLPGEDNADLTSDANPYRFWVNDDDDGDQSRGEGEFINNVHDHEFNRFFGIRSRRDLEDFARLHINLGGLQDAIVAGTIKVGLKWKEGYSGAPAINVYLSADATGSDSYVTDATGTAASAQITGDFKNAIKDASNRVTVDTSGVFIFGPEFWAGLNAGSAKKCLLFEGDSIGLGQLVVVLLDQNGNSIGEGPGVWIDLRNIKSMYQQYRATPTSLPRPFDSLLAPYNSDQVGFEAYPGRPTFQPPSDEEQKVLVFVNGSNEPYAYSTSVAETVFKRLWWQGYKGRLASFRWETLVGPFSGEIPAHYNLNEWLAWNWGKGLRDFVASPHIPNGYTVNVAAHSLGCTLVGSALQLGMSASNVVLLQGAIPAGCFDTSGGQSEPDSINGYERMWEHEAAKPTPDNFSALGYRAFVPNVGGATIYNFYNEQDYALFFGPLDAWEGNQRINKPDGLDLFSGLAPGLSYQYNPSVSLPVSERGRLFFSATGDNRHVTTPYESMAFIARSRSKALGAKDGVGGIVNFNVNIGPGSGTDLQDARPDHSGEFTRSIQQLQDFYRILFDIIE